MASSASAHVAKKAKYDDAVQSPEDVLSGDLEPGACVVYWDGRRGIISDAFEPLDEFWVLAEESGDMERDENGDVYNFKSSELSLVARPPIAPPNPKQSGAPGGVMIIGDERQMMKVLTHFGEPDPKERHQPQLLLAFPCEKCAAHEILACLNQGIDDPVRNLAAELRPDIHVAVRAFHFKHAVEAIGDELLRMEGFFLLSAVSLPHTWDEIESVKGWNRKWRREVCNQIDVGPTARGLHEAGDTSPEDTARRVLGQELGVLVSLLLWDEEVQMNIRRVLDVELPLQITDANGGTVTVLMLPSDAMVTVDSGILAFTEAPDAEYLAAPVADTAPMEEHRGSGDAQAVETTSPASVGYDDSAAARPAARTGGKTIDQWEKEQAQYAHLPKIPADWVRVKSQKDGAVYFFNKKTKEATFEQPKFLAGDLPLPAGWTTQVSNSTGKTYYWHAEKRKSMFERPTE